MNIAGSFNYLVAIALLMTGLYMVLASPNLVKKVIGLNVFQTAVFVLFISMGVVGEGSAPILGLHGEQLAIYSNPLPHVLILTAIVVGVATTAVGLALTIRIHDAYGTVEDNLLVEREREDALRIVREREDAPVVRERAPGHSQR